MEDLRGEGYDRVYLSFIDTDQYDELGGIIQYMQNRRAIEECDEVHVLWTGALLGSTFGLGMAFALRKPLKIVRHSLSDGEICLAVDEYKSGEKSLENLMWAWEKGVY